MVTLTNRADLLTRHALRFSRVEQHAGRLAIQAANDLHEESLRQVGGAPGQPQGQNRRPWLNRNRPFARSGGNIPAVPNPVGRITNDLASSIRVDLTTGEAKFSAVSYATVPYAKYVFATQGTSLMVPRLVRQNARTWMVARMGTLLTDLSEFQRSLY